NPLIDTNNTSPTSGQVNIPNVNHNLNEYVSPKIAALQEYLKDYENAVMERSRAKAELAITKKALKAGISLTGDSEDIKPEDFLSGKSLIEKLPSFLGDANMNLDQNKSFGYDPKYQTADT